MATELATVRNQCVRLLGRLGGSINNLLVTQSLKQKSNTAVTWDTEKHLKFNIPFIDLKPTIYFGWFHFHLISLIKLPLHTTVDSKRLAAEESLIKAF